MRVSGKLYKDALVMYDRETGTLWTQVDGRALRGPLAGQRLVQVPATHTTWKAWKKLHPNTLLLRKPPGMRGSRYEYYSTDPAQRGLYGTAGNPRFPGKTLVVGIHSGEDAVAVPLDALRKKRLLETTLAGEPVVIVYSDDQQTPTVFRARVEGRALSFRLLSRGKEAILEDNETHSRWLPLEGRAVDGPLAGKKLEPVPYLHSYWYAWSAYRPRTRVVGVQE